MGADAPAIEARAADVARRIARRSALDPIFGFGSVFGKTLRDSRWAVLATGLGAGLIVFATASQVALQFPTAQDRLTLVATSQELPAVFRGLLGDPINVDRLGGFLSWRITSFLPIIVGLWSILALSGTLAGEARRGSLDFLVTTPLSRVRLATEKAAAHLTGLVVATILLSVLTWLGGLVFARLPGDEISVVDSLSQFAGVTATALVPGALAFLLAPVLGRVPAAGIGVAALFAAYIVNSYASLVPILGQIRGLSWFGWTANHRPLAGASDPVSVVAVAGLGLGLIVAGIAVFTRRDIGSTVALPIRRIGESRLGLRGPAGRSFASRLPAALAWGAGIGAYGAVIAASATVFAEQISKLPGIDRMIEQFYPGIDFTSSSGFLQLAFFGFGLLLLGLAATESVSGWTSDEREKRLDLILSAPISRFAWAMRSGAGVLAAIGVMTFIAAVLVAVGALADGSAPWAPFLGVLAAGLYSAAIAGVGIALAGLFSPTVGLAGAAAIAVGSYLLDFIGGALRLPPVVLDLALSRHLGEPMLGRFDWPGLAICAVLAVGGVALGAWGLQRRDLKG